MRSSVNVDIGEIFARGQSEVSVDGSGTRLELPHRLRGFMRRASIYTAGKAEV